MKVDLKIVTAALFFALIAVGVLAFVRWTGVGKVMESPVLAQAEPVLPRGLDVKLTTGEVTLEVQACDISALHEEFFLHLYPADPSLAEPEGFISQQFNLKKLKPVVNQNRAGVASCHYRVEFSPTVLTRVSLGQFRMPNGRCCEVLWIKDVKFDE
ncbi:hypothetical protein AB4P91_13895 [Pseudomonas sp. B21128]|uniref:hypothetical protein n=1 Tax=Pseudomonas TaxID=286 RepID=UPI00125A8D91|nr:hypothetical protein [Pseudomonas fluorescens]WKV95432.1 hypothetical protein PYV50_14730 [Pseudomonas sp. H22_DOA]VVP63652.1 hypothetical protein PS906_00147 [Pseudomonas fluorescens]